MDHDRNSQKGHREQRLADRSQHWGSSWVEGSTALSKSSSQIPKPRKSRRNLVREGKQPAWVVAELKSGETVDDLAI